MNKIKMNPQTKIHLTMEFDSGFGQNLFYLFFVSFKTFEQSK